MSIQNKYLKWYLKLCNNKILERGQYTKRQKEYKILHNQYGYTELHHILPACICTNEQKKDKNNFVILTAREHFIAHLLLTKCFNSDIQYKMKSAMAQFMRKSSNQCRKLTARQFEICRIFSAESAKYLHTGVSKPKTTEHRQKISQALIGRAGISRPSQNKGKPGKPHTEKTKEFLSNINLGKIRSAESCNKQSLTMQGHPGYNNKKWKIIDIINNIEYFPSSVLEFARDNSLCAGNLYEAERSKSTHKKQWRVEKITD